MSVGVSGGGNTSAVLKSLVETSDAPRISVGDIVSALGGRAYALLLVILGLPNCLPMPPPIPLVCGLLVLMVALQLLVGLPSPWLPRRILGLSASRSSAQRLTARALPWLEALERLARPRLAVLQSAAGLRLVGGVVLICAIALLVAAPFVGQIPLGIAICLIGLGLVERDGLIIGIGALFGLIGVAFSIGFVWAIMRGLMGLLHVI
jgi:hypothetical protein